MFAEPVVDYRREVYHSWWLFGKYIYIYKTNYISPRVYKRIGTPVLYVYTLGGRSTVSITACNLIERVLC